MVVLGYHFENSRFVVVERIFGHFLGLFSSKSLHIDYINQWSQQVLLAQVYNLNKYTYSQVQLSHYIHYKKLQNPGNFLYS